MANVDDAIKFLSDIKKLKSAYRRLGWKSRKEGRENLLAESGAVVKQRMSGNLDPKSAKFYLDVETLVQALEKVLGK